MDAGIWPFWLLLSRSKARSYGTDMIVNVMEKLESWDDKGRGIRGT